MSRARDLAAFVSNADGDIKFDTDTLFIDSSANRVGIGTTTPSESLHIANANDAVALLESTGSDATDDANIQLKTTNGTFTIQNDRSIGTSGALTVAGNTSNNIVVDHNGGDVGIGFNNPDAYVTDANSLVVKGQFRAQGVTNTAAAPVIGVRDNNTGFYLPATNTLGITTDGTERMRIDSSGRVTMPSQPSFHVQVSAQQTFGSGIIVAFGTVHHNIGSHFANNRFTAPVAGNYQINYTGLHNIGTGNYARTYLYKNGSAYFDGLNNQSANGPYERLSWSIIVSLSVNDYLEIFADSNNTSGFVYNHYTHWSGHLLG